jgi:hypothetical protein
MIFPSLEMNRIRVALTASIHAKLTRMTQYNPGDYSNGIHTLNSNHNFYQCDHTEQQNIVMIII